MVLMRQVRKDSHMEKKQIKAFYLDPIKNVAEEVDITDTLDTYYDALGCRCIDIQTRKLGDKWYDFVIDDEGLFAEDVCPSALCEDKDVMFVGALFVTGVADDEGELTSLTDEDITNILNHVGVARRRKDGKFVTFNLLTGLKYR